MLNKSLLVLILSLSFGSMQVNANEDQAGDLYSSISQSLDGNEDRLVYKHIIKFISLDESVLYLEDGMSFSINWWYSSIPKNWKKGDQIYITFDFSSRQYQLEHPISQTVAWGAMKTRPSALQTITKIPNGQMDLDAYSLATLENGYVFRSIKNHLFGDCGWKVGNSVMIFSNSCNFYQLWNIEKNQVMPCTLEANINQVESKSIEIQDILGLEDRLNAKVLGQPEATQILVKSLLNYTAGLTEKERPVGVFLFLGPTGVGKTELAKALTQEIYQDLSKMVRFDMSHFSEPHSLARLIGAPPGYVNHEEGGQLTNPLQKNPQIVVLLDEMEKAHPNTLKFFLPIFDEGSILDINNRSLSCQDTIFILTSNLCGKEISELYRLGYSTEKVLELIEPTLMDELTPELYNRVQPILFKSLGKETMGALVETMLKRVEERVWQRKKISLRIDDSLKDFLVDKGYHPLLGARPLKKLIDKRVVSELAYYIIKNEITNGGEIHLLYDKETDTVQLELI